jgi:SAM-dependent methyltransferase
MINDRVTTNSEYYRELRISMLSLVRGIPERVLEVGCASGEHLRYLKERGTSYTVGVEISPEVADRARHNGIDEVLCGNVEESDLGFADSSFDLVVVGHVLEHLRDPWGVLKRLRTVLKPGGQLVGALPNVRHHSVILPLVFRGDWTYAPSGIMDWTHLRFFTRDTVRKLLSSAGFQVEAIVGELGGNKSRLANRITLNIFQNFLCYAYNFAAINPGVPTAVDHH